MHAYTALGLIAAGLIAVLLVEGGPAAFRWSFLLMAAATIVDSTDGFLARKVRIKEVVPSFDGRRLDDLVDFLNYTCLPLLLIWRAGILPPGQEPWLFLPLLASAYGFCQVQAKTDDGYFLGFPSLWNVVAFYLYMLPLGPWPRWRHRRAGDSAPSCPHGTSTRHNRAGSIGWQRCWVFPGRCLFVWLIWKLPQRRNRVSDQSTHMGRGFPCLIPRFYLGVSWAISVADWQKPHRREPERVFTRDPLSPPRRPLAGLRRRRRNTREPARPRRTR